MTYFILPDKYALNIIIPVKVIKIKAVFYPLEQR